jgi:thymidylate kinase
VDRLGWSQNADAAVPWLVFDGPSAVGKDTQIDLSATALRSRDVEVMIVGGTGAGTDLGPLVQHLVARNAMTPGRTRWVADYRLKAGAWEALRRHVPARASADVVLCNRGPLSQLVYSAVAGGPELLDSGTGTLENTVRSSDLGLLLTCPDDIVLTRARHRAATGQKALRTLDTPEFIAAANQAYRALAASLPWVQVIDATGDRKQNLAAIMRAVDAFLGDAGEGGENAA